MLGEGWKSEKSAVFQNFSGPVDVKDINVVMRYRPGTKVHTLLRCINCRVDRYLIYS